MTAREWEVLALLREGMTNEQIASRLGISYDGAKFHVSEIITRLGVADRYEAARWQPEARRFPALGVLGSFRDFFVKSFPAAPVAVGLAGLALLAAGVAWMELRGPSDPAPGKIAWVADGDVWARQLPDGQPERLTQDGLNSMPAWSPSGGWLTFMKNSPPDGSGAYVMREDGTQLRQLQAITAYWSPEEDILAYVVTGASSDGAGGIVVENTDGSGRRELLPPEDFTTGFRLRPTSTSSYWSPDGEWLTFIDLVRPDSSTPGAGPDRGLTEVVRRVRVDDGEVEDLYTAPADIQVEPGAWTADNQHYLLLTREATNGEAGSYTGPLKLLPEGSQQPQSLLVFAHGRTALARAPDGDRFALVAGDQYGWQEQRIAMYEPGTGTLEHLTDPGRSSVAPAWSPNGERIAYISGPAADAEDRQGASSVLSQRRLWMMDSDGAGKLRLTDDPRYRDESPRWLADDRHILFVRIDLHAEGPAAGLWLVDTEDGALTQVAVGMDVWEQYGYHFPEQQVDYWHP